MSEYKSKETYEELILNGVNRVGADQPEVLEAAYEELSAAAAALRKELPAALLSLFRRCENAFMVFDGEIQRAYYMAGLRDGMELKGLIPDK